MLRIKLQFFSFLSLLLPAVVFAQPSQTLIVDLFRSASFGNSTELDTVLSRVENLFKTQIGLDVIFRDIQTTDTYPVSEANLDELKNSFKDYYDSNRPTGSDLGIWVTSTVQTVFFNVYEFALGTACPDDSGEFPYGYLAVVSGNPDFNFVSLSRILGISLNIGSELLIPGFIMSGGITPSTSPMPTEFSSNSVSGIQDFMQSSGSCLYDGASGPQEIVSNVKRMVARVTVKRGRKATFSVLSAFENAELISGCDHRLVFVDSKDNLTTYNDTFRNSTQIEQFSSLNKTLKTGESARLYSLPVSKAPRTGGVAVLSACSDGQAVSSFARIKRAKRVRAESAVNFKENFSQ